MCQIYETHEACKEKEKKKTEKKDLLLLVSYMNTEELQSKKRPRETEEQEFIAEQSPSENTEPLQGIVAKDEIIKLNVSGTVFTTSRSTLNNAPSFSMLGVMFNDRNKDMMKKMPDGSYWIDADPEIFKHLLRRLRRKIPFGIIPRDIEKEEWFAEIDYWGLNPPQQDILQPAGSPGGTDADQDISEVDSCDEEEQARLSGQRDTPFVTAIKAKRKAIAKVACRAIASHPCIKNAQDVARQHFVINLAPRCYVIQPNNSELNNVQAIDVVQWICQNKKNLEASQKLLQKALGVRKIILTAHADRYTRRKGKEFPIAPWADGAAAKKVHSKQVDVLEIRVHVL